MTMIAVVRQTRTAYELRGTVREQMDVRYDSGGATTGEGASGTKQPGVYRGAAYGR